MGWNRPEQVRTERNGAERGGPGQNRSNQDEQVRIDRKGRNQSESCRTGQTMFSKCPGPNKAEQGQTGPNGADQGQT